MLDGNERQRGLGRTCRSHDHGEVHKNETTIIRLDPRGEPANISYVFSGISRHRLEANLNSGARLWLPRGAGRELGSRDFAQSYRAFDGVKLPTGESGRRLGGGLLTSPGGLA